MFPELRNFEFSDWKMIEMRMNPTITGRSPVSPERRRITQARAYSGTVFATIAAGTTASSAASASTSALIRSSIGAVTVLCPGRSSGPTDRT